MNKLSGIALALAAALALLPVALGELAGSGNVTDIVQLSTETGTLSVLSSTATGGSASGSPVTSGSSAFTLTNSGSNVDTFVRYAWGTTPYYGASTSATSITIRSVNTHYIGDLLWFQQQKLAADTTATTSAYFSPLLVKSASSVQTATFTSAGNACTSWTGTPGAEFTATAAGTLTFKYYNASGQTNDAPATSDVFQYCLDGNRAQVYLGTTADFAQATRVYSYTTNSANGVLSNYQYQFLSTGQTNGNFYCLTSVAGSGTTATPELAQCQKLPYDALASTTIKLFVLQDPPAYFPSVNQGGTITYGVSGTQWNPYSQATTNGA